jgi:NAD(P)-dependent dehydrogenase (short-subunit alcohol dehydrogenase family)
MKFLNKIAVVTGGNSGIGLATAKLLTAQGAKVAIVGRDQTSLDTAVAAIGGDTLGIRADIREIKSLDTLFSTVARQLGNIDILFANAGIAKIASIAETTEEFYNEIFDINVKGTFFTIQKALPYLNDQASIILNTTFMNQKGAAGTSVYAAGKAALRCFVRVAATEFVGRGIRVNAVSPGPITTPIYGKLGIPAEAIDGMAAAMIAQIPMQRFGTPEEVANTVLFLASEEASYITGVEIEVGGGIGQV